MTGTSAGVTVVIAALVMFTVGAAVLGGAEGPCGRYPRAGMRLRPLQIELHVERMEIVP